MNNERYNQIIDETYGNYVSQTMFVSDPTWLEPIPVMNMKTGEKTMGARQYQKEGFINKCKTDSEFSERWGLKIEERVFSLEERSKLAEGKVLFLLGCIEDSYDEAGIPTKLITLTYNNETIESYES